METYYLKSKKPAQSPVITDEQRRPLLILNGFRTFIASIFVVLYLSDNLIAPLGVADPRIFFQLSLAYLLLGIALWFIHHGRQIPFHLQVWSSALIDILMLTLLMHVSGGIQSGLGALLVITIAGTSVVMGTRTALGLAALATLAILSEQFYAGIHLDREGNYPVAGLLGLTYFFTSLLFVFLARRIRESEALARKRGIDLANLSQLTEHIIERMQTGILVLDETGIIRLINESAARMLDIPENRKNANIDRVMPQLAAQWRAWQENPDRSPEVIRLMGNPIDISPRFAKIGDDPYAGALIFLQDMAAMAQQAQQLQLASLGRLTASIAHEIRNPLGAISHAGQLLAESEKMEPNDVRLTQIIAEHSKRLNTIVESIMSVSRRKPGSVELFNLKDYLEDFLREYCQGNGIDRKHFEIRINPHDTEIRFDSGHLGQILTNLCDNAIRHSRLSEQEPTIILSGGYEHGSTRPHLDVIDNGPGVTANDLSHIFEPFFTTETTGTGLGLYLSRELAETNQAHLSYHGNVKKPGCFRLTFQDPRRQFNK